MKSVEEKQKIEERKKRFQMVAETSDENDKMKNRAKRFGQVINNSINSNQPKSSIQVTDDIKVKRTINNIF